MYRREARTFVKTTAPDRFWPGAFFQCAAVHKFVAHKFVNRES